jgi:hypothetical protein
VEQQDNGLAKRPVAGINIEAVDGILKQMVGFNNMFDPYYLPRTSVEEVDGQQVLVIWAPSGVNRPYAIPMDVQAKVKQMRYYVLSGSSSIIAKGDVLDELRDMANHRTLQKKHSRAAYHRLSSRQWTFSAPISSMKRWKRFLASKKPTATGTILTMRWRRLWSTLFITEIIPSTNP